MRYEPRGIIGWTLSVLLCLAGAVAAVNAFSQAVFSGNGLTFSTRISLFAAGETRLSLPPLGVASARTHRAPVRVQLELRGLTPALLADISKDPQVKTRMLSDTLAEAKRASLITACLALALGGLGSLAAAAIACKRRGRLLAGAFFLGVLLTGTLLSLAYLDYDPSALEQPRYEGLIESAPWIMSVLTNSLDGLDRLGQGFAVMARNLPRLSRQGQAGAPMSNVNEDLRVLHVSDIHNNRAAFDLIESLARNFEVDLVIDTGDLTDYGTPFESELADSIRKLRVPYVFVPGNHDTPEVVARLRRVPNVLVADGGVVTVKSLRILGCPDPAAAGESVRIPADGDLEACAARLAETWEGLTRKPDVVAVHNAQALAALIGKAPVLLYGHDHRAGYREREKTVLIGAGTTGAAGWRGLASEESVPYTLNLQYWRREADRHRLVAVDAITVDGLQGQLQVARTLCTEEPAAEAS